MKFISLLCYKVGGWRLGSGFHADSLIGPCLDPSYRKRVERCPSGYRSLLISRFHAMQRNRFQIVGPLARHLGKLREKVGRVVGSSTN